jgi:hypothetical protein
MLEKSYKAYEHGDPTDGRAEDVVRSHSLAPMIAARSYDLVEVVLGHATEVLGSLA